MIETDRLLADAKKQVVVLVDDLRTVAANDSAAVAHVAEEYRRARTAGRTALGQTEWAEGVYAQVAVGWVLGCVFVRFCEDNDLIADPLLGGPDIRTQLALDHRAAYLHANPAHDDRHWLREIFGRLRALPATGEIFGAHNPIWLEGLLPSADGARRLREDLTRIDADTGQLRHDFTDPIWDTRFLGDLYQDLSDHAKKTFALLQTPVFVEEFILDRTLEPAIATFGLADTTIIDPTCGSGHFLLGAFDRLFQRWVDTEPAANRRALAQRSLDAIGGVDLNPFAASVARFRLLLAALRAGGDIRLVDAPAYDLNIAVGDSLLHGDPPGALPGIHVPGEEEALLGEHGYTAEDHAATRALLSRGWSAVVGNPPYIVVKDPALNAAYRQRFKTCHRQYSLGVPFTERFWQLARPDSDPSRAGYVGLITANSFMKREFGRKFIEKWVPRTDLTHVIDTSGAFIPGHGTPTVILFGRNRLPVTATTRVVMGIGGERSVPVTPALGPVWQELTRLLDQPGAQGEYASASDVDRVRLATHPWSLGGGGAAELRDRLDSESGTILGDLAEELGFAGIAGDENVLVLGAAGTAQRLRLEATRELVEGDSVRDWRVTHMVECIWPYDSDVELIDLENIPEVARFLWPFRRTLQQRKKFGIPMEELGRPWWEWRELYASRLRSELSIVFANVSTHNYFVLDRGGHMFNGHAPVIKLSQSSTEADFLDLAGLLNSSTACFWIKQVCQGKGNRGGERSSGRTAWEEYWEIDGTKLRMFPVPTGRVGKLAAALDDLGSQLGAVSPAMVVRTQLPTAALVEEARHRFYEIRARMIAVQEELDWQVYELYGLSPAWLVAEGSDPPPLALGQRAFEIATARALGGEVDPWFVRHGATPTTHLPPGWPPSYCELVERRISALTTDPDLGLLERPEHKRRWTSKPWEEQVAAALTGWLLDRLEGARYWSVPAALTTVARLAAEARTDDDFVRVARVLAKRDDVDIAGLVGELVKAESVPYLAALRYTDSGLRKHLEWRNTWDLQRGEDAGEAVRTIPVPPKYGRADFVGVAWDHRGKLDVPRERFVSYPGAERETDSSAVVAWGGWNHLEHARALASWYLQAKRDGREREHVIPLLAGLAELVPWLKQWYDEPNVDPSLDRPGSQVAGLVETETRSLGLTAEDLASWRPPAAAKRGRPRKATA